MVVGMRRRLARVADWLQGDPGVARSDARTFELGLDDGRHVTVSGFAVDARPPGYDTGDVLERSRSDAVSVVLSDGCVLDLPLARIARVRSGRSAPAYLREFPDVSDGDRLDLADGGALRRFLECAPVPHVEFARRLALSANVTMGEGMGPVVVLAADLAFHSAEGGATTVERLHATAGRMDAGVYDPSGWGRAIHEDLTGPLGRDLRDLDDAGGVRRSLVVALRCVDTVLHAAGRTRDGSTHRSTA